MMEPHNISFLLLAAVPVSTIVLIALFHTKPSDLRGDVKRQFGRGLLGSIVFLVLFMPCTIHYCGNGQASTHTVIAMLCIPALLLFCKPGPRRIVCVVTVIALSYASVKHYHRLVHTDEYLGTIHNLDQVYVDQPGMRTASVTPFWHTPFTRLYRRHLEPIGIKEIQQPGEPCRK